MRGRRREQKTNPAARRRGDDCPDGWRWGTAFATKMDGTRGRYHLRAPSVRRRIRTWSNRSSGAWAFHTLRGGVLFERNRKNGFLEKNRLGH